MLSRATALHQAGRLDEADRVYRAILASDPNHIDALNLLGTVCAQQGNLEEAVRFMGLSLEIDPKQPTVLNNQGNALQELNRYDEAIASYDKAISLRPAYDKAYCNRGIALQGLKRHEEAIASYDKAISLSPEYADAHYNRGNALSDLSRYDEALANYDNAIALQPDHDHSYTNRGVALQELNRYDEALASYEKAILLNPHRATAYSNRGSALLELRRYDEAVACCDTAIALDPDDADAHSNRGSALQELGRHDEALASYEAALALNPDHEYVFGSWLNSKMYLCDWRNVERDMRELFHRIQRNEKATPPFSIIALTGSLPLQRQAAEIWVKNKYPAKPELGPIRKRKRSGRMRIGYFSADFRMHPVSLLTAGLYEAHDKTQFEVYAFSIGPDIRDEMRTRLEKAFDHFIDVRNLSDREVAALARRLEIDIAIDLGGHTASSRVGIFALRAAPLQVSYVGYLGTMGADYMDYLIADGILIPESSQPHYSEKIVYLPSYQVNDSTRKISDITVIREALGLPETGFVYCCFNNSYKILPATFDGWMRILRQVEHSVLWLLEDNATAARNLRKEAEARGVDTARLIFAKRVPFSEYLSRFRAADLFIDTLPYNAGATASDALWAGLPVLTCMGEAFAGRVAASLLNAIELPELVTTSQAQYEALAVELATQPQRLKQIRQKLQANRRRAPLFDTALFTRNLEAAYTQMVERYQADQPPEHLYVKPQTGNPSMERQRTDLAG